MTLEQFKNSASERLETHLTEREVRNVERAACMADDFQLVHWDERDEKSHGKTDKDEEKYWEKKDSQQTETRNQKESEKKHTVGGCFKCYNCGKSGHIARTAGPRKLRKLLL